MMRRPAAAAIISSCCPVAITAFHVHPGYEEFYVLEGEAVESDGTVTEGGRFHQFSPGFLS